MEVRDMPLKLAGLLIGLMVFLTACATTSTSSYFTHWCSTSVNKKSDRVLVSSNGSVVSKTHKIKVGNKVVSKNPKCVFELEFKENRICVSASGALYHSMLNSTYIGLGAGRCVHCIELTDTDPPQCKL